MIIKDPNYWIISRDSNTDYWGQDASPEWTAVGSFIYHPVSMSSDYVRLSPNPPKDTDGRREDSGRGWVRELQGRWPGVLG